MGAHVWGPAYLRDHLLPQLAAQRVEHGLVRRHAGVPLLHGGPGAGDRRPRRRPAVRRGVQAGRRLRARHAAVLLLGVRPAGPLPLPDARAVRLRRAVLRARRELQHLRRQPEVDDGRRVLVLDRPQPDDPRPRPARPAGCRPASTAAGRRSCSPSPVVCHGIVAIYVVRGRAPLVDLWLVNIDGTSRRLRATALDASASASLLLSAFWIGPFVGNHQYMTDMKYGARPEGAERLVLGHVLPARPRRSTSSSRRSPSSASSPCVARRHVERHRPRRRSACVTVALVYLTQRQPAGHRAAVEPAPAAAPLPRALPADDGRRRRGRRRGSSTLWRNRPAARVAGLGSPARSTVGGVGLVVLIVLGFMFEVLPGGGRRVIHDAGKPVYAWGPLRKTADRPSDAQGDGWSRVQLHRLRGPAAVPRVLRRRADDGPRSARPTGCGRVAVGEQRATTAQYGTTMALMLLPHWTDGCIGSMEGLFFEASGTTPYHFLTAGGDVQAELEPGARAALRQQRRRRSACPTCRRSACAT